MLIDKPEYAAGRETELWLLRMLRAGGWQVEDRSGGKMVDLFVIFPMLFALEIKNEDNYAGSPNVCVETFQGEPRHPSGIETSTALFYVHTLGPHWLVYHAPRMRDFIKRGLRAGYLHEQRFCKADNANGGVLVSREAIRQHSMWADEFPRGYLLGAISNIISNLKIGSSLEDDSDNYMRRLA